MIEHHLRGGFVPRERAGEAPQRELAQVHQLLLVLIISRRRIADASLLLTAVLVPLLKPVPGDERSGDRLHRRHLGGDRIGGGAQERLDRIGALIEDLVE